MAKVCPRAADSFLMSMGESRGWEWVKASVHLALCSACRTEVRELRATSMSLRSAIGASGRVVSPNIKGLVTKGALVALSAIVVATLWIAGREAILAAAGVTDGPKFQQATYHGDQERQGMNPRDAN